jgi:hypothetical protein
MKGSSHYDFSDLSVLVPQAEGTKLATTYGPKMGTIKYQRRTELLATYLKAFWDMTLLGQPAESFLEKTSDKYPEMNVEKVG